MVIEASTSQLQHAMGSVAEVASLTCGSGPEPMGEATAVLAGGSLQGRFAYDADLALYEHRLIPGLQP